MMVVPPSPSFRPAATDDDLLLRETDHRCSNDLQLVVSLLGLQSRRVTSEEARVALSDAAERVAILARARAAITRQRVPDVETALTQVCTALLPYAEPRGILIALRADGAAPVLAPERITALALVVNELMTNAIKHAFRDRVNGRITVSIGRTAGGQLTVSVDDDGLPYPAAPALDGKGLGLGLARRLMASIDGFLIAPVPPAKTFELRVNTANNWTPA